MRRATELVVYAQQGRKAQKTTACVKIVRKDITQTMKLMNASRVKMANTPREDRQVALNAALANFTTIIQESLSMATVMHARREPMAINRDSQTASLAQQTKLHQKIVPPF